MGGLEMRYFVLAAAACLAPPLAAQTPTPAPVAPTPDAARLAAAERVALKMLPPGAYANVMREMMGPMMDGMMAAMLDMDMGEMAGAMADGMGELGREEAKAEAEKMSGQTMRQQLEKEDPHFAERMRIMGRVMGEGMGPVAAVIEPAMRRGLVQAYARRYTAAELAELERFYATPLGARVATDTLMIWMDPEVMKASMAAMPEMMKVMPDLMKKLEAATAHLPPPPKREDEGEVESQVPAS